MKSVIIVVVAIAAATFAHHIYTFFVKKRIKSNVQYCENETLGHLLCLLICELPKEYRILYEEETDAYKILEHYREDMAQKFIKDGYSRECASMSEHEFFIKTLYVFLDKRCCYYQLGEQCIAEYKSDANSYTKRYFLTDFGVVFYKLLLATAIYNQKAGAPFVHTSHIYDTLNTREFEVMTYLP